MYPRFVITETERTFCYVLLDEQGAVMLSGNRWRSRQGCLDEIRQVKVCSVVAGLYSKIRYEDGQYSFTLLNKKRETIGHGATWWSRSSRDYAIVVTRRETGLALIEHMPGILRSSLI